MEIIRAVTGEGIKELLERIASLEKLVVELRAENERLRAENEALKRQLNQNSGNSHKPPSSEGYAKKTVKPGLPRDDKKAKGGQAGHTGKTLMAVERPDKVQVHLPGQCAHCQREFKSSNKYEVVGRRQVFDLPEPKLEITEHQVGTIECCGSKQCGKYPEHVTSSVQYGPRVRAWAVKMSVDHKLPLEQICQYFKDMYGYELNSETVESAVAEGSKLAQEIEAKLKAKLSEAPMLHADETGIRVAGKLMWLHVVCAAGYIYMFVDTKRGAQAIMSANSVLKAYNGYVVHDYWSAYFKLTQVKHAMCMAHVLRELQGLMEAGSVWGQKMHDLLLSLHRMPRPLSAETFAQQRERYHSILSAAECEEPPPQVKPPRGRAKSSPGRNLLNRLTTYESANLAFAQVEGVPFTNNLAERAIRPVKVKLKVSGCFRTLTGASHYARLQSIVSSIRLCGGNVFSVLHDLFAHRPAVAWLHGR
jgi:transposase